MIGQLTQDELKLLKSLRSLPQGQSLISFFERQLKASDESNRTSVGEGMYRQQGVSQFLAALLQTIDSK